ncbi:DUF4928 family protein [Chitinophaga sp. CB10]|uniref:DUF4928 family protein n=1 Tax=Chitinophaga sp. CB10 TaxID=1891659 RepID=UPI000AFC3CC0|nr:DUF4928 family protein [Chitinophaga sp. CB10]
MQANQPFTIFENWYASLKLVKANGGPAIGTIAASLVLLDRLKRSYDLELRSHLAAGGAQIKGAGGNAVSAILRSFNENRPFAREGGRTNRGVLAEVGPLLQALTTMGLENLPETDRNEILTSFQAYLVDRVRDYHNRQKLKLVFDAKHSTWQIIHQLIKASQIENKGGPVAQHLVGAKLQLRFPDIEISNEPTSAADAPTHRLGDFCINNTVFHVTVAPMLAVFEKCQQNINQGFKPFLLVPDSKLAAARELGEQLCEGQIAVESLESFISQNIEELSTFSSDQLKQSIVSLVKTYNNRVDKVEIDKSLMIELPSNLNQ